jgi:hypothetical protein
MRDRVARAAILTTGMGVLLLIAACQQFGHQTGCGPDGCPAGDGCHDHAKVCADPTVHALACDLDHLEKHIDWYGSVVPKVPDVWGQARLTQYREEFEREMHKELVTFGETLNGSLSRSDQAYFAQATALGLAAQPKPPVIGRVVSDKTVAGPTGPPAPAVVETSREVVLVEKAQDGNARTTTSTFGPPAAPPPPAPEPPAPAPIPPPPAADPTTMISEVDKVLARNNATVRQIGFAAAGNGPVRLEPTLFLAQKQRYLDYLNQLRRTNEGADTADAPGYSLNLMRVPVSVLPGKRTDVGHGAEVTFSLEPVLGDDLLPMTYRNFVTNDLVHSLGFPLTKLLDDERTREAEKQFLSEEVREALRVQELSTMPALGRSGVAATGAVLQGQGVQPARFQTPGSPETAPNSKAAAGRWSLHQLAEDIQSKPLGAGPAQTAPRAGRAPNPEQRTENNTSAVGAAIKSVALNFTATHMSFSNGTRDRQAFPTSQMFDVYGANFSFEIAYGAKQALASDIIRNKYVHLPDVQAYLQEEIRAAHQFLAEPAHQYLWQSFCTPDLVAMIRSHQWQEIRVQRTLFRDAVMKITGSKQLELVPALNKDGTPKIDDKGQFETETNSPSVTRQFSVTSALAWGIIVDSALLTDRLIRDMRETATAKGKPCPGDGAWLPYFLPCPPPEARMAFAEYVKVRWPIHVFALDPVTQDQNIADALSTRRETQLALSIAFTNGFINANTLTRYARRLEAEYETVALNRTQVGFAHGENTFGWRFYPRFQTPDTESNLTVLFRDQLIGGPNRNQLARHARLEPGPRDCVALVIMPSFVPYVTVDSVSNWFGLANPKHKVLDHTQAVRLSKTVRTLEKCGPGVMDADCYRDGEVRRLQKRVDQLANRLPAQTLTVPVPILNTLGGFEMFSNGVTDLAPELYGWYGAPGVRTGTSVPPTTLFLVGDHFSPLKSRVVIGNAAVTRGDTVPGALLVGAAATTPENQRMLSRQVMEVTIDGARVFPVVGAGRAEVRRGPRRHPVRGVPGVVDPGVRAGRQAGQAGRGVHAQPERGDRDVPAGPGRGHPRHLPLPGGRQGVAGQDQGGLGRFVRERAERTDRAVRVRVAQDAPPGPAL